MDNIIRKILKRKVLENPPIYEKEYTEKLPSYVEQNKDYIKICQSLEEYFDNPEEFLELLKNKQAYISGSFPLSVLLELHNKESFNPGDLDIFVNKKYSYSVKGYLIENDYIETKRFNSRKKYGDKNIFNVKEFKKNGKIVQIIAVKNQPEEHILKFDLSCCKVSWDNNKRKFSLFSSGFGKKSYIYLDHLNYNSLGRIKKYLDRGFKMYHNNRDITTICYKLLSDKTTVERFILTLSKIIIHG
jgi:hypothetical protein